jgi:hypothetical protein
MGSSATCWTAHFQGFSFNNTDSHHAYIVDAFVREVWSIRNNVELKGSAIARLRDATGLELRCIARNIDGMLDTELLASIAQQMMTSNTVDVNGKSAAVSRTSKHRLRALAFTMDGREYQAIEQNAEKASRWGQLAREGHRVVQFKDGGTNKFVAASGGGHHVLGWLRGKETMITS